MGLRGPELQYALNEAGYLPSYDTGGRCVAQALQVLPNVPSTLVSLWESVRHVKGVQLWQLSIDELHVEDVVTFSHEARAVGLCATCCTERITLCSGADVEALGE